MFSSSLEDFKIHLNNPTATYAPGEIIEGRVIVDLKKTKSLRALKLRFNGKCEVRWSESRRRRKRRERTYFTGNEEYFRTDLYLFGDPNGNTVEMPSGHHAFPFNFNLPRDIPSTFDHDIGSVVYSIKAIIDRPWKFDHEITVIFAVENPLELSSEYYSLSGINDEVETDYFCLLPCINKGYMTLQLEMPTTGYACGESIEVSVYINNKSSVRVTKLELLLEQRLEFYAQSPYKKTRVEKNTIQKTTQRGIFENKKSMVIGLQVPSVPHSNFDYCGLIDISYYVWISVFASGCHCSTEKRYNILIGRRPPVLMSIQDSSLDSISNTPSAPSISINNSTSLSPSDQNPTAPYPTPIPTGGFSDSSYTTQPTPIIGFIFPNLLPTNPTSEEIPPPSYDCVMANDAKK